jgi:hypothetical protein
MRRFLISLILAASAFAMTATIVLADGSSGCCM